MGKSKYRRGVWGLAVFLTVVLCAVMLPAAPLSANGTTVGMVITPTPKTVTVNDTFSVNITVTVSGGAAVSVAEAHINFNTTYLQVVSIGNGTALANVPQSTFNNTAGTIDYGAGTALAGVAPTTNFTLATLNLRAKAVTNATSLTFVYDGLARETLAAISTGIGDVLNHAAVNGSVQVLPMGSLSGHLGLQRAYTAPNATWSTNVTVVFFQPVGTNSTVRTANVTTDNWGNFTVPDVPTGTYDIGVWCHRSLSELATNVTFSPANATAVTFGAVTSGGLMMREGDVNNDDIIDVADYAVLYFYYGATSGPGLGLCDFNSNGAINMLDYQLLWQNYGQKGDMWGKWLPPASP